MFLMGAFGAKGYIIDIRNSKDALGIFDAMVFDSTIIVILATLIISSLIGIEFKNRSINNDIYSGKPRRDIFLSKIISYLIIYNLIIIIFPIAGCLRMIPVLGFGTNIAYGIFHIIKIILYSILLNSAMYSVCVFIAFICKDLGKTLSLSAIYILSFALIMAYGKPIGLFDKVKILNFLPLIEIRYVVYENLTNIENLTIIISSIIMLVIFILSANKTFKRAELK